MLTDSQVALFWITNNKNPQKEWVRLDITKPKPEDTWRYIDTKLMTTDIGTRREATLGDFFQNFLSNSRLR